MHQAWSHGASMPLVLYQTMSVVESIHAASDDRKYVTAIFGESEAIQVLVAKFINTRDYHLVGQKVIRAESLV